MSLSPRAGVIPTALLLCLVPAAAAQESAPPDKLARVQPLMAKIRHGEWALNDVQAVVKALIDNGMPQAAGWWARYAEIASERRLLPSGSEALIKSLRQECAKKAALTREETEFSGKLLRHLESVVAVKNYEEARRAFQSATVDCASFIDPKAKGGFDRIRKVMEANGSVGDRDMTSLDRQKRATTDLLDRGKALLEKRIDRALVEFERAGCKPGRVEIRKLLHVFYGSFESEAARARLDRLMRAARGLERTKSLELWILGGSGIGLHRDGVEERLILGASARKQGPIKPIVLDVLSGDRLVFEIRRFTKSSDKSGDTDGWTDEILVHALLDGKPLDAVWSSIEAGDLTSFEPDRKDALLGKKEEYSKDLFESETFADGTKIEWLLVFPSGTDQGYTRAFGSCHAAFEKEFAAAGVPGTWVSASRRRPVLLLEIP